MHLTPTPCCALAQLSCGNDTKLSDLRHLIALKQKEAMSADYYRPDGPRTDGGERAVFVIVSPGEDVLAHNLAALGFRSIAGFNRRNGYPAGYLSMWMLSW